jgi:hypothetical protein
MPGANCAPRWKEENPMSDLDREIEEALGAEDRALYDELGEKGIFAEWFGVYRGPQAWIMYLTTGVMLIMTIVAFYSIAKLVNAGNDPNAVRWGGLALLMLLMVSFIKVWFWMRMESNRVIREVKRLELQIARLQLR